MSDAQHTEQAQPAGTVSPAHVDTLARALRSAGVEVGSVAGETFRQHAARRLLDSTDPEVHAALLESVLRTANGRALALDALTRHGVLTEDVIEPAAEWDSLEDAARGVPGRMVGYRRLVTRWEPTP